MKTNSMVISTNVECDICYFARLDFVKEENILPPPPPLPPVCQLTLTHLHFDTD
mgnify:CR=1 FL=1